MKNFRPILIAAVLILTCGCSVFMPKAPSYDYSEMDILTARAHRRVERFVNACVQEGEPVKISPYTRIDSLVIDRAADTIDVYLNRFFAHIPMRETNVSQIYEDLSDYLGWRFAAYGKKIHARHYLIDDLIPNYYRSDNKRLDRSRLNRSPVHPVPLIRNISDPHYPGSGLNQHYIALWHSHGWYYEQKLKRWEWQRARLFQTVEDLGPLSFTIPYLVPMLENAGATVFLPRERDLQTNEVIIDNDSYDTTQIYLESRGAWKPGNKPGFAIGDPPYDQTENPFRQGTFRIIRGDTVASGFAEWIPTIPEEGEYSVSVSWCRSDSNITDAHYTVYHAGGQTEYLINQQIGGQTWIYLGAFWFKAGRNPELGKVVLDNRTGNPGGYVTADAARFGGGMGNIMRGGTTSGRPRYTEGARYYLQYAGMPDTLVYSFNDEASDYRDDYQSRGEWVNYLRGGPFGPNLNRTDPGLGIPIDLAMAFHTDAGITRDQSVFGTLSIYSTFDADSALFFPDTMSRLANRDLADIMQSQIVSDLRAKYDPEWTRRDLWDRQYSEAYRPNIPSVLLELLSHQNFTDMKFALDPRFRFDVGRAIYKSMLRFIATQNQSPYVVQPLPVSHVSVEFDGPDEARLSWRPVEDVLEPSAAATAYKVYMRAGEPGFDNGIRTTEPRYRINGLKPGVIYSFKITAVNDGGESFPSEIVAIGRPESAQDTVLVINAFDRVAPPAVVETAGFEGFFNLQDEGVPDRFDVGFTGVQFNFDPASKWTDDDAPGFGASYADFETSIIAGNTFDYPAVHGKSLMAAGFAFVSTSDEIVDDDLIDLSRYPFLDLILGEEKATAWAKHPDQVLYEAFPPGFRNKLEAYFKAGGRALISGAYIGTELFTAAGDSSGIVFAQQVLKVFHRSGHAVRTGGIVSTDPEIAEQLGSFVFNTVPDEQLYRVEAPDALEPADTTAKTLFRYSENNMSAGVGYRGAHGVIVLGFPFETVVLEEHRHRLMNAILRYLKR